MGEGLIVRRGGAAVDVGLFIEPGLIVEFFGLSSNVPNGWQLCDGTNNTPNLIDKFVVGAGDTYSINDIGGSADAIIPTHTHSNTVSNSVSHNHSLKSVISNTSGSTDKAGTDDANVFATITISANGSHSHGTVTFTSSGESATDKNLPPYFGLFHIMKMEEV